MKLLRRATLIISLIVALVCIILLLNFTAPNPTGRRYSSQIPLTTGQGDAAAIGNDGERIMAADLRLPNNNAADQRKCICGSGQPDPNQCSVCIATVPMSSPFRRPDFVGQHFLAEVKNAQELLYEARDLPQIRDYAEAAKLMNVPLWLFVRTNTLIDPEYERLVNETGGGVVRYVATPDYVDPVDEAARNLLGWCVLLGVTMTVWESAARRRPPTTLVSPALTPLKRQPDPLGKAIGSVERAQQFKDRYKDNLRDKLD